MKKILLFLIIFNLCYSSLVSKEPKLVEIFSGLNGPWSFSFINDRKALITEKQGNIFLADKKINN